MVGMTTRYATQGQCKERDEEMERDERRRNISIIFLSFPPPRMERAMIAPF